MIFFFKFVYKTGVEYHNDVSALIDFTSPFLSVTNNLAKRMFPTVVSKGSSNHGSSY